MPKDEGDNGESIFMTVFSLLIVALVFGFLWYKEVLRDWLSWGIAIGCFAAYVVIAWFLYDKVMVQHDASGSSYIDARRLEQQGRAFLLIAPGWFIVQTLIKLFGGKTPTKR